MNNNRFVCSALSALGVAVLFSLAALSVSSCKPKGAEIAVSGISVSQPSISITEGETATISYTVEPSDASEKGVSFSSSNPGVATVSDGGEVTAVSPGSATITLTTRDGGFTATVSVTVKAKGSGGGGTVKVTGVTLDRSDVTIATGSSIRLVATVVPEDAADKTVEWKSSKPSAVVVDDEGLVSGIMSGSATITATTKDGGFQATCYVLVKDGYVPEPEAVDMGTVVNGKKIKWAPYNLGASKPEEYGDHFAWGEIAPKTDYSWITYKHMVSGQAGPADWKNITKYTFADGQKEGIWYTGDTFIGDGKTSLKDYDYDDDAARQILKGSWRLPTDEEWTALQNTDNFKWDWTNNYEGTGVAGRIVISKVEGYAGNSIFLPAAGGWNGDSYFGAGSCGYYWSSSLFEYGSDDAMGVAFDSELAFRFKFKRYYGLSVRAVTE